MLWVSLSIIVVFGGATLWLHDETFIKWKPTVLYWLFSAILVGADLLFHRNLIRAMMEKQFTLPVPVWRNLNLSWAAFFLVMGAANLYVAFHFPTETWVNFKLFGGTGLLLALILSGSVAAVLGLAGRRGISAASMTRMLLVLSSPEIPVSLVRCIRLSKICRLLRASRCSAP